MKLGLDLVALGMIVALTGAAQAEPRNHPGHDRAPKGDKVKGKVTVVPSRDRTRQPKPAETGEPEQDIEIDWSKIDLDSVVLMQIPSRQPQAFTKGHRKDDNTHWSRTEKVNGAASTTVKRALSTGPVTHHVGLDVETTSASTSLPGAQSETSTGSFWMSTAVPVFGPLPWDKATIDARIKPNDGERVVGANFSKSIPVNETVSMTLQNGYNVTQTLTASTTTAAAEQVAKFNLLPTGTSLFAGAKVTSTDSGLLNTVGAEQKIFGGLSITGKVSETTSGTADRSLTAAFKRAW